MTIEEKIVGIKKCAKAAIETMVNHKVSYLPDNEGFEAVINKMHAAQNKDQLAEAYLAYINLCIGLGYSDGAIIAGIQQNEAKNNEFNVNIDNVIKSLINIKSTPVNLDDNACAGITWTNNKELIEKLGKKNTKSENPTSKNPLEGMSEEEIRKCAEQYDPNEKSANFFGSTPLDILHGDLTGVRAAKRKAAYEWVKNHSDKTTEKVDEPDYAKNRANDEKGNAKMNEKSENNKVVEQTNNENKSITTKEPKVVEQTAAAHNESGFNINNFIKQAPGPATMNMKKEPEQKKFVFPHEIANKTDDEIIAENAKHFNLIPGSMISAYALYDLIHNKQLKSKMKEYNSKQRPNNITFTQVNINEYIGEPELLAKYPLAFTTPCEDKGYVIVVLFNPVPETKPDGYVQYPIHIIKAKLTKPDNK